MDSHTIVQMGTTRQTGRHGLMTMATCSTGILAVGLTQMGPPSITAIGVVRMGHSRSTGLLSLPVRPTKHASAMRGSKMARSEAQMRALIGMTAFITTIPGPSETSTAAPMRSGACNLMSTALQQSHHTGRACPFFCEEYVRSPTACKGS
jgi:hypothetical protein